MRLNCLLFFSAAAVFTFCLEIAAGPTAGLQEEQGVALLTSQFGVDGLERAVNCTFLLGNPRSPGLLLETTLNPCGLSIKLNPVVVSNKVLLGSSRTPRKSVSVLVFSSPFCSICHFTMTSSCSLVTLVGRLPA